MSIRDEDIQGPGRDPKFHRSLANVLAVGVNVKGQFSFDLYRGSLLVLDLAKTQMASEINRGEEAE
jgi:hypothetical protein